MSLLSENYEIMGGKQIYARTKWIHQSSGGATDNLRVLEHNLNCPRTAAYHEEWNNKHGHQVS